jgi:hypothetical protein
VAAIDDIDFAGIGISEDEEVVPNELELQDGLLGMHRRAQRELLRLDDLRLVLFGHVRNGVRCGAVRASRAAPAVAAAGAVAGDLALELGDELVDRCTHVRRGLARTEDGAVRPDRGLGDMVLCDRRVLLHGQLELDTRVRQLSLQLRELRLRIAPDRVADLEVPALDLELHRPSFDAWLLARNLADDSCKSHHVDSARAALAECGRRRAHGGAARVHVVDQDDSPGRFASRGERTRDVPPAVGE